MKKTIIYICLISFFNINFSFAREEKYLVGVNFSKGEKRIFAEYVNQDDRKIRYFLKKQKTKDLNYSGYRNVEGFKNKKRKNDLLFAGTFVAVGLAVVFAGALAIKAVADALD